MALILYNQGEIDLGDIVGYMGLLALFGFPTFISLVAYSQVARGMAGARRILSLIQSENNLAKTQVASVNRSSALSVLKALISATGQAQTCSKMSTLTLQPGKTLAIVGQTGAGKSTIAKLINRTYDVSVGDFLIDGIDVREWNLASLRRKFPLSSKTSSCFHGRLPKTSPLAIHMRPANKLKQAAQVAQAHEFIMRFPGWL